MTGRLEVEGRLVLDDLIEPGRLVIEDGWIASVEAGVRARHEDLPFIAPGFVDVHVHGRGGFDAMGGPAALDGMARHLLRHGVTSFLPTAVTASLPSLARLADDVRGWMPGAPGDGAMPLGFNLEGPLLAPARRGEHVHRALWPIITRTKPADRLMLVSDGISLGGMGDGRGTIGGLPVEVVGQRVTLLGTTTLAGSVIALDTAVRNLVESGVLLPA